MAHHGKFEQPNYVKKQGNLDFRKKWHQGLSPRILSVSFFLVCWCHSCWWPVFPLYDGIGGYVNAPLRCPWAGPVSMGLRDVQLQWASLTKGSSCWNSLPVFSLRLCFSWAAPSQGLSVLGIRRQALYWKTRTPWWLILAWGLSNSLLNLSLAAW